MQDAQMMSGCNCCLFHQQHPLTIASKQRKQQQQQLQQTVVTSNSHKSIAKYVHGLGSRP